MNKKIQILGKSVKFQEVLRTIELVSVTDVPVLLSGEIGTGKELLAQKIHESSHRNQREFISVNCAALPQEFAESMLFGQKIEASDDTITENNLGYIAQAQSGTLFLDEISELPLAVQAKVQRFLENGEIQAVGDSIPHKYDVRLIAATHKNLNDEVNAGNFRADLFYRLNIIPVELPALKEREGDINILMEYFFREFVREQHQAAPSFTKAALKQITQYGWPGNVRELHNFCERMFILFSGKEVDVTNLPHELRSFASAKIDSSSPFSLPVTGIKLEMVEVDLIQQALQNTNGNKSRAARLLGLTRDTFLYRLKKYSIDI
ncbi:MAG TPA: sigma-54-dependent Fis family transcriptional regulator [Leucothrix sp.]|nr:sigma-54-dependent Fis family transcriptional regulator [Leucothrix sp.]